MRKIIKELCKDKYIWVFLLIAGITFFMTAFFYKTGFFPYTPIHSDGNGYYMYLPAWFVYHDPGMHFVQNLPPDPSGFSGTFFPMPTGQVVDKYTMGVAILQMPFFSSRACDYPCCFARKLPMVSVYFISCQILQAGAFIIFWDQPVFIGLRKNIPMKKVRDSQSNSDYFWNGIISLYFAGTAHTLMYILMR